MKAKKISLSTFVPLIVKGANDRELCVARQHVCLCQSTPVVIILMPTVKCHLL